MYLDDPFDLGRAVLRLAARTDHVAGAVAVDAHVPAPVLGVRLAGLVGSALERLPDPVEHALAEDRVDGIRRLRSDVELGR